MADISYLQARRLGLKEMKTRAARHEDPYLPSLEELLPHMSGLNEEDLGSTRIDIDQIVGTRTAARREAFSHSFYPLLEEGSEFAAKWSALAASHLQEETVKPSLEGKTLPTCEAEGSEVYRAVFENEAFAAQSKETVIPAAGHKEEIIPGKAATLTETGLTEGVRG